MNKFPTATDGPGTKPDLTDEHVIAALAVRATASGAAAYLSSWNERVVTAEDVLRRINVSPRLQRVAAFCALAQGRTAGTLAEERIRALAGPRRWRDRRARK
jgi:hypothetical protein